MHNRLQATRMVAQLAGRPPPNEKTAGRARRLRMGECLGDGNGLPNGRDIMHPQQMARMP